MLTAPSLEQRAQRARRYALFAIHRAGSGHPGGSLSVIDLLAWLFERRFADGVPNDVGGDHLILSKGHAAPGLYAVAAEFGLIEPAALAGLRKLGSPLQGHTHVVDLPWTGASTGSLGQGFSVAIGKALGLRHLDERGVVWAVLGDGELQEGEVWEGAMFAAHHGLSNLVAIVDYNKMQSDDLNANVLGLEPLREKWEAFGWRVLEVCGHDFEAFDAILGGALRDAVAGSSGPTVVLAHTQKGRGVSYMEGKPLWHGSVKLSDEDLARALLDLKTPEGEIGAWVEGNPFESASRSGA